MVLTCTADGGFPPPMVIFKGKTDRTIKNLCIPEGFIVVTQEKAWMDDVLMLRYIEEIWMAHVRGTGSKESLLTLDRFSAHISESSTKKFSENNVHTCVIPGGCTSILQPLDVCLNKPFKCHLRKSWQEYMLVEMEKLGNSGKTKVPPPSRQDIVNWIAIAWKALKAKKDQITKSFVVTGIETVNGERLIRNEAVRQEIEKVMEEVFGNEQIPYESDGNHFDQISSDSESDDSLHGEDERDDIISISSEGSISCGEFSELTSVESP